MAIEHRFIEANGIRLHYVEAGRGPLVVLLHGFPEFWYSWRFQLPALAAAGFRVVAPDLRGYNLTDKPRDGYNIENLVVDVTALVQALGEERAQVVGHDWGGIIAWQTAWRRPELVRSLVAMNAPHPAAFARFVMRDPLQMLQSSYALFFQVPGLPEWVLTRDRAAAVGQAFRRNARQREVFTAADVEAYRTAFLRPGVARCSLEYYRQALRQGRGVLPTTPIEVPTLVLWGRDDPVLRAEMNDQLERWVKNVTITIIPDCGHWTQQEQPDVVTSELIAWLRAHA